MKRLFPFTCLLLALNARGQEALSANDAAPPRPLYRYLIVVDTSSSMSRQKEVTVDTVHRLILSGIIGRIRTGEVLGVWTFDEQLHSNALPAVMWDSHQGADVANRVYRFLRDLKFDSKKRSLDQPLAAIADEAQRSGSLTAFLFTDGAEPVKGTPFDDHINGIFKDHAKEMRKAKAPFVTVFAADGGKWVAHSVNPGGGPIYMPRVANTVETAKRSRQETNVVASSTEPKPAMKGSAQPAAAESTTPPASAPKKPLSVEEISKALRESQSKRTNVVVATQTTPPASNDGVKADSTASAGSTRPNNVEANAVGPPQPIPPAPESQSEPGLPTESRSTPAVVEAHPTSKPAYQETVPTPKAEAPPSHATQKDATDAATAAKQRQSAETVTSPAVLAQTADLGQPAQSQGAWKYLLAAVALLLAALALAWLYIRSIRYVPRPSIISQSLDKERK